MFAEACSKAMKYTLPLIPMARYFNGEIGCGIGSLVVLNDQGWFVTCAHMLSYHEQFLHHKPLIEEYEKEISRINNLDKPDKKKKSLRKRVQKDDMWVSEWATFWGNGLNISDQYYMVREADLLIAQFKNFNPLMIKEYPKFVNPKKTKQIGTGLCKLGFPFHSQLGATYNWETKSFSLKDGSLPAPLFPIEGIFTREYVNPSVKMNNQDVPIKYIETSSPGLKGQSGGPTFDSDGNVWAIQSQTRTLPLGFIGEASNNNEKVDQFINVGLGIHAETILTVCDLNGISYSIAD